MGNLEMSMEYFSDYEKEPGQQQIDWSTVTSVDIGSGKPVGFNVDADGLVTFGEAFQNYGDSYTVTLSIDENGVTASLVLQDNSS